MLEVMTTKVLLKDLGALRKVKLLRTLLVSSASLLGAKTLLGAPGLTTSIKKLWKEKLLVAYLEGYLDR